LQARREIYPAAAEDLGKRELRKNKMELQYLEIHKEHFDDVYTELGRDPTWEELEKSYRDKIACVVDFYKDFLRMNENMNGNVKAIKHLLYSIK
jgi:hypothetical protein